MTVPTQPIFLPELDRAGVSLFVRREDLVHPVVSGNKYRKLKYNLQRAKEEGHHTLLTFGGAFSNHILATAHAGKANGFKTIGIIRGEELSGNFNNNATLSSAKAAGMRLHFVSRQEYREKYRQVFLDKIASRFGRFYLLPEGGTNALAIKGCSEILQDKDRQFDVLCCAVGTGGTLAGIISASQPGQKVIGFTVLKGEYLKKDICSFVDGSNWHLQSDYHFGGYAKINETLIAFINGFRKSTGLPLDPVYTGKLFYGILDMARQKMFLPGTKILAIHTGGLQGIAGMNQLLEKKKLPLIDI